MAPEVGADGVQKKQEPTATFVSSASPAAASDDPRAHADGHPGAAREIMAAGSSAVPPSKVGYLQMAPDSDTLPAAAQPDGPPQPDGESQVDPSSCHSSPAALGPAREGESPQASLAGPVRCSAGKRTAAQPLVTTAARSDRFNVGDGGSGVEIGTGPRLPRCHAQCVVCETGLFLSANRAAVWRWATPSAAALSQQRGGGPVKPGRRGHRRRRDRGQQGLAGSQPRDSGRGRGVARRN